MSKKLYDVKNSDLVKVVEKGGLDCYLVLNPHVVKRFIVLETNLYNRYRTLFPYKPDPRPNLFRHTIQNLGIF